MVHECKKHNKKEDSIKSKQRKCSFILCQNIPPIDKSIKKTWDIITIMMVLIMNITIIMNIMNRVIITMKMSTLNTTMKDINISKENKFIQWKKT